MEAINKINELTPIVTEVHGDMTAAIVSERDAEGEVLTKVIEKVKPALRAICGRVVLNERTFWVNVLIERETGKTMRGLHLDGSESEEEDYPRGNQGNYEGCGLFLRDDGQLVEVTWTGHWTRWQGRSSAFEAEVTVVTPREAMDDWKLSACVESIAKALEQVNTGNAKVVTQKARERAEKLAAVAKLL